MKLQFHGMVRFYTVLSLILILIICTCIIKQRHASKEIIKSLDFSDSVSATGPVSHSISPPIKMGSETNSIQQPIPNRQQKAEALTSSVNVPITFYCIFLDQNNAPVPDVTVEAQYIYRSAVDLLVMTGHSKTNVYYSDTRGNCIVTGIVGNILEVHPSKPGYEMVRMRGFAYGYGSSEIYKPDSNHPYVFHVWRRGIPAGHLESLHFLGRFDVGGTVMSLDLTSQKSLIGVAPDRRPSIKVWRNPTNIDSGNTFVENWSYEFEWPEFGVKLTDDSYTYLAPETGYSPLIQEAFKRGEPGFVTTLQRKFYFKTANGKYGCGTLEIMAHYRDTRVRVIVDLIMNPDQTRNLEPEP